MKRESSNESPMQAASDTLKSFDADDSAASQRLDRWLAQQLPDVSRTQIQTLIQTRRVQVNGQTVVRPSQPLAAGDRIRLSLPPAPVTYVERQAIPLEILYEDEAFIAVNKSAGMVVYPAPGHAQGTLVNALLHHTTLAGVGAPIRPGIVHRLDRGTSGVMVVAKTDAAYHALIRQFKERSLKKIYLAWVWGALGEARGRIEAPIGRHPVQRKRMAVLQTGKPAVTEFIVKKRLADRTLLEIHLLTGRTHQVRVHCAYIKHPVVGDQQYGRKTEAPRMMLHAWKLHLDHPLTGVSLLLEAPPPAQFQLAG
ncbi:MAG TPA: RluA family pseudouridine synthase [Candidatus Bipolaricaulota bacterium]